MTPPIFAAFLGALLAIAVLLFALLLSSARVRGRNLYERRVAIQSTLALEQILELCEGQKNPRMREAHELSLNTLEDIRRVGLEKIGYGMWGGGYY